MTIHVNDPSYQSDRPRVIYNSNFGIVHVLFPLSISWRTARDQEWQCYHFLKLKGGLFFLRTATWLYSKTRQGVVE